MIMCSGSVLAFTAAGLIPLSGCNQILGIESVSPDSTAADGGNAAPPDGPATMMSDATSLPDAALLPDALMLDTSCVTESLTGDLGTTPLDTDLAADNIATSCGGMGSPEQVFLWTAPTTDYYVLNTFDSEFDTALAIYDECGGNELSCSNNVGAVAQSEVVQRFTRGQQAILVVDGVAGDRGIGKLDIARVTCPDIDLEGQTLPIEQSTLGFGDDHGAVCGGLGVEDRAYHWVAPADGLYYFRAEADGFRPIVSLLEGARCSDRELGCNTATRGDLGAEVVRYVRSCEAVGVLVDGVQDGGLFQLDIGLSDADACPANELSFDVLTVADFGPYVMAPSCSFARAVDGVGTAFDAGSLTYRFVQPGVGGTGSGSCDVIVTSEQEFALSALERDDCGGAELACVLPVQEGGNRWRASLRLELEAVSIARTIVISDRVSFDAGAIEVSVVCQATAVR